jgi:sodium/potassium-transporting ATPase subunit alpha
MTVTNLWSGGRMYSAFQSNNDEETTAPFSLEASGMAEMVDIAALNSRVKFDKTDVPFDQRQILGDATETGLARFAGRQLSSGYDQHQKSFPKVFEVPFNSTNKWALVILNKPHADGVLTSYIKGAPERVLAKCSTYLKDGVVEPMTDDFRQAYDDAYDVRALLSSVNCPTDWPTVHGVPRPPGHRVRAGTPAWCAIPRGARVLAHGQQLPDL